MLEGVRRHRRTGFLDYLKFDLLQRRERSMISMRSSPPPGRGDALSAGTRSPVITPEIETIESSWDKEDQESWRCFFVHVS